jgi:cytoskeletal protein CcmA (bactofilin family)
MALWKDSNTGTIPASTTPGVAPAPAAALHPREPEKTNVASLSPEPVRRPAPAPAPAPNPAPAHRHDAKESFLSADLTIEGKIVGSGHVRIAGRFKGDVQVDGNVSLDSGARLEGGVKAQVVSVGGELIGNIENAKRVELLETGVINGDVKAGSLTVAAGSRMRGQVEFGYEGVDRKTDSKGYGNA